MSILLDRDAFAACLSMEPDRIREDALRIHAPFRLRRRGVETKLVLGNSLKSVDRTLLRNIANALSWLDRIKAGKTYEEDCHRRRHPKGPRAGEPSGAAGFWSGSIVVIRRDSATGAPR